MGSNYIRCSYRVEQGGTKLPRCPCRRFHSTGASSAHGCRCSLATFAGIIDDGSLLLQGNSCSHPPQRRMISRIAGWKFPMALLGPATNRFWTRQANRNWEKLIGLRGRRWSARSVRKVFFASFGRNAKAAGAHQRSISTSIGVAGYGFAQVPNMAFATGWTSDISFVRDLDSDVTSASDRWPLLKLSFERPGRGRLLNRAATTFT